MRVTQQMMQQNSIRQMNQNLDRFNKINNQVASGNKIQRPSDDPNGVSKAMNLKSALAANEQYDRNTTETKLWMDETDQTIGEMVDVMQRVRELAVKGTTGTLNDTDRQAIQAEVTQLAEQMRTFGNSQVNGKYLFNGTNVKEAPFPSEGKIDMNALAINQDSKMFAIGDGVSIKGNVTADELFGTKDANIFATLSKISEDISSADLSEIDADMNRMLSAAAINGARLNRVEAVENRVADSNIQLKSMLSKIEDVDYAEAMIQLKSEESVYQATLAASAKIIQPSLMDFLR
ncbi:flagellar hook-associated protein FlgL [Planococcus sp. YIM B11945]|uniref:flagellar hook-associated protein FlgL n=1 Tax=Planococcus sp. YIM B11945 TaxID=3435410 RepID=UPI003D7E9ECA